MSLDRFVLIFAIALITGVGCRAPASRHADTTPDRAITQTHDAVTQDITNASNPPPQPIQEVQLAAYQPANPEFDAEIVPVPPIDVAEELSLDALIDEVLTIHPSVEAMYAAWQAAADRYPQAIALEDPMFGATFAPSSFGSPNVESAYALELSQKLPWLGKRALRGAVASAEADSADRDLETTRQKLAEFTALAFWDFYLIRRQLDLNQKGIGILQSFRKNAANRYQTGLVTSQDLFQADIELANLEQRRIELERMDKIAAGRINVLLRRRPTDSLPPPPISLTIPYQLPDQEVLIAFAEEQRPDVAAAAARVQVEAAKLGLAYKDYFPDVELFGRYDTFWQPADTQSELRPQFGIRMNVPTYRRRLNAAVCGANHEVTRAQAELEQLLLDVQSDVQSVYEQVRESQRTLELYNQRLLPAAQQNVDTAAANYDTSKINFLDLAISQRQLIEARERHLQAEVELQRRIATLRRITGGSLPEGLLPVPPVPPSGSSEP